MPLSTDTIRSQFPSLSRLHEHKPLIYLDGPGGTQVPNSVLDAMTGYYVNSNTNTHGVFVTAMETDAMIHDVREHVATLLGAEGPENISLGQNMTTLNFALARGISKILQPGDEVVISQLDHEGNRGPWLTLREKGIIVREIGLLPDGTLDEGDFERKINEKTRLVAIGMASNAIGTVNNVALARKISHKYGAWLLLDAVHYAPHFALDVQDLDCDFLLCSAYKFYGPHIGILYSRTGLLDQVPTDRLRTTEQMAPFKIETGTLNHAALAGVSAAIRFIASLGEGETLREKILDAYKQIGAHENLLARRLYEGLSSLPGIRIIGQGFSSGLRAPTISFVMNGKSAIDVC
ncbi:MAG: cysteine desulfurase-like protein, partial [Cyclobacteriaceae bacterium]|nr:cysteine desulfurase-like protein [Cyclobacteriaceae bacterium]